MGFRSRRSISPGALFQVCADKIYMYFDDGMGDIGTFESGDVFVFVGYRKPKNDEERMYFLTRIGLMSRAHSMFHVYMHDKSVVKLT